jgi:hypothetical protein
MLAVVRDIAMDNIAPQSLRVSVLTLEVPVWTRYPRVLQLEVPAKASDRLVLLSVTILATAKQTC